ncbi:hypothetical protein Daus18300_009650 [Diaporthe australafricana]|uniref:FAD-binding domain-containing protein n=1 Tax=Diaporthe australafricana TaxID=127596 RepID=A0ABR3WDG4_9PEZI
MTGPKPHVLIVGGGIGGLTLAQCLRKKGISFEIFERDPDWRTSGWCIYIHSIIPELLAAMPDDVPDLALTNHLLPLDLPSQFTVYLGHQPGGRYGVTSRGTLDMIRANRAMLRQFLATKIPCQMGKRAVSFEESSESVTVQFEDGTSATGSILVRDLLLGQETKPQPIPVANIGGEVTLSGSDFENELRLGHSTRSDVLSEPAEPGLPAIRLFSSLKRVLPDGVSGEYYWFVMWFDDTIASPAHWIRTASTEELHDFVIRTTRGMAPEARRIVDLTSASTLRGDPFPQRALKVPELPTGRVTLLGDAAHCMPPTRGEAGVHAMRDALKLAESIGNINAINDVEGSSTKMAVAIYNEEMIRRGSIAVQKNIDANKLNAKSMGWGGRDFEPLEEEHISLQNVGRLNMALV